MGDFSERRSDRLFSNQAKLWMFASLLFLVLYGLSQFEFSSKSGSAAANLSQELSQRQPSNLDSLTALPKPAVLDDKTREEIEKLFQQAKDGPEKEKSLQQIRHLLEQVFAGQEDCWSCEGAVYFERLDELTGE